MGEEWVGSTIHQKGGKKIVKKVLSFPLFDHKAKRHTQQQQQQPESIELVQTRRGPFRRLKNTTFFFFSFVFLSKVNKCDVRIQSPTHTHTQKRS